MFEVSPADDELMIAEPMGNQKGLGMMGFCYVPYHFVYDLRFPLLVQLTDGADVFQFPVVVLVDKNTPRAALNSGSSLSGDSIDICSFKEGRATIATFDTHLNPIEADISYQCFDQRCSLGRTSRSGDKAVLEAQIPLCANGQLSARAQNFSESKIIFSSNSETSAELILAPTYPVRLQIRVNGQATRDTAIVHFTREDGFVVSSILPEQQTLRLEEGLYNITVFVYGNSSVTIPGTTKKQCTEVPRGGIAGFFGSTEEKCFDITTPETKVDSALRGGGHLDEVYILESEIERGKMDIFVNALPQPMNLEQLQTNFELFDEATLEVSFP